MIPTEDIISIVKNTITASIKCNTHRGYIGWSSCDNICMDMHDCLDMCAETLEMRGYMVALEAATYILVSGVKLASHADSSSGMHTDVIMCTYELIEKCAKEVEKQDKQMRDQALALIIKEAKKSVFDGWTDWRYDLLKCGICLCDEKSAKKLEKVLDTLLEISREDYPEQVYELCYKEISESCAQAKDRREYKKITKNIAQLIKWKGNDTAKLVIKELKQTYPRRPALLDELEKVEKKL